jgi:hypothetical protein
LTSRRFSVLDAMILVAATAVGFGAIRTCSSEYYNNVLWPYRPMPAASWLSWSAVVLSHSAFCLSPLPAAWTVAALVLRLRAPRPPLARLMRQPGAVAGVAATLVIALGIGHYLSDLPRSSWHDAPFEYTNYALGCAVAAGWLILALSRRWRAEPSWLDRLGRGLGVYWIGMVPLTFCRTFGQL